MNQKEWSLSINCPQNVKMMILNQNLLILFAEKLYN